MSLLAVGVSHQTAPVALLEQFAMGTDDTVKALHELVGSDHVSEAMVLATCNRVEVFAEVDRFHGGDRKSTRLNSSHANISYAVFCLKKKKNTITNIQSAIIH